MFECRIAHPRRHHQGFFMRAACDRKTSYIAFGIGLGRIKQSHVEILAGLKCPVGGPLEAEGHRTLRDFMPAQKSGCSDRGCCDSGHMFFLLFPEHSAGDSSRCESYPRLLAEILIVFPPSALALADVCVSLDELDGANVLDHRETELCLHAQAERRTVIDRKRLAIHFVGKDCLRIIRELPANRAVEVPRSLGVRLRCRFVVERVEDNVPGLRKRAAESDDMTEGDAAPFRNA